MNECNGKLELVYQFSDKDPKIHMIMSPESGLEEVLEAFERFLRAAGYCFDGQIEINGNIIDAEQN